MVWSLILKYVLQSVVSMSHHGNRDGKITFIPLGLIFSLNCFSREQEKMLSHRIGGEDHQSEMHTDRLESSVMKLWQSLKVVTINYNRIDISQNSLWLICWTAGVKSLLIIVVGNFAWITSPLCFIIHLFLYYSFPLISEHHGKLLLSVIKTF